MDPVQKDNAVGQTANYRRWSNTESIREYLSTSQVKELDWIHGLSAVGMAFTETKSSYGTRYQPSASMGMCIRDTKDTIERTKNDMLKKMADQQKTSGKARGKLLTAVRSRRIYTDTHLIYHATSPDGRKVPGTSRLKNASSRPPRQRAYVTI